MQDFSLVFHRCGGCIQQARAGEFLDGGPTRQNRFDRLKLPILFSRSQRAAALLPQRHGCIQLICPMQPSHVATSQSHPCLSKPSRKRMQANEKAIHFVTRGCEKTNHRCIDEMRGHQKHRYNDRMSAAFSSPNDLPTAFDVRLRQVLETRNAHLLLETLKSQRTYRVTALTSV